MSIKKLVFFLFFILSVNGHAYECVNPFPIKKDVCDQSLVTFNKIKMQKINVMGNPLESLSMSTFNKKPIGIYRVNCQCIDVTPGYFEAVINFFLGQTAFAEEIYENMEVHLDTNLAKLVKRYEDLLKERASVTDVKAFNDKVVGIEFWKNYVARKHSNFQGAFSHYATLIDQAFEFARFKDDSVLDKIVADSGFEDKDGVIDYHDFLSDFASTIQSAEDLVEGYTQALSEITVKIDDLRFE